MDNAKLIIPPGLYIGSGIERFSSLIGLFIAVHGSTIFSKLEEALDRVCFSYNDETISLRSPFPDQGLVVELLNPYAISSGYGYAFIVYSEFKEAINLVMKGEVCPELRLLDYPYTSRSDYKEMKNDWLEWGMINKDGEPTE